MEVYASGGKTVSVSAEIWTLASIWRPGKQRSGSVDSTCRKIGLWLINLLFFRPRLGYSAEVPQGGKHDACRHRALRRRESRVFQPLHARTERGKLELRARPGHVHRCRAGSARRANNRLGLDRK